MSASPTLFPATSPPAIPPQPASIPEPVAAAPDPDALYKRAVLLSLELRKLGNRRKVPTGAVTVDAEKRLLAVSKKLLDSDEMDAISKLDGDIRQFAYSRCLESPFRAGVYFLPVELIAEVHAALEAYQAGRAKAVEKLCESYPALKAMAAQELRVLFNERDYPSVDKVRAAFRMTWQYQAVHTPRVLEQISPALFAAESEKARQQIAEASAAIRDALRQGLAELVTHMVDRLTPGTDGKSRIFRDSLVGNFADFLRTFEARNITDDGELSKVAAQARQLLAGVDPAVLRQNAGTRDAIRDGMSQIKQQLDTMLADKPERQITFEEEN